MRAALLLSAFVLLLSPPTAAQAGWRINRSLAIAQTVWHPACGQLRLSFERPAADMAGWAWAGDCTIRLNAGETWSAAFEPLCETVLHEAGHVAGREHSNNPRSVMYPRMRLDRGSTVIHGRRVTVWPELDRRCRDRGRPYLEAHGLLQGAGTARYRGV